MLSAFRCSGCRRAEGIGGGGEEIIAHRTSDARRSHSAVQRGDEITIPVTTEEIKSTSVHRALKHQETEICPTVSSDSEAWILLSPGQRSGSAALGDCEVSVLSPRLSFIRGLLQPLAFAAAANLLLRRLQQQAEVRILQTPATHQLQQYFEIQTLVLIKNVSPETCL